MEERLGSSTDADRQFVWGSEYIDELVLRDRDTSDPPNGSLDERLYALQDANWNVAAIADTGGDIMERFAFDAYGKTAVLTGAFGNRVSSNYVWEYRYTGRRLDEETCLYCFRERYDLTILGRFQSRDPVGYEEGTSVYAFARGNPLNQVDPFGLACVVWFKCTTRKKELENDKWCVYECDEITDDPRKHRTSPQGVRKPGRDIYNCSVLEDILRDLWKEQVRARKGGKIWRDKDMHLRMRVTRAIPKKNCGCLPPGNVVFNRWFNSYDPKGGLSFKKCIDLCEKSDQSLCGLLPVKNPALKYLCKAVLATTKSTCDSFCQLAAFNFEDDKKL